MRDGSWKTLGRSHVYENPWCAFRVDEVELPDGAVIEYGVLESGGFAAVVPITDDGQAILVRQWRQPLGRFTLELPSGAVDDGEDPRESAERELLEETGYRAEGVESLISVHTSTGRSTEICHLFCCQAVKEAGGPRPEPTEFIEVVELAFGEVVERISGGEITDAATVLGVQMAAGRFGTGADAADTLH